MNLNAVDFVYKVYFFEASWLSFVKQSLNQLFFNSKNADSDKCLVEIARDWEPLINDIMSNALTVLPTYTNKKLIKFCFTCVPQI